MKHFASPEFWACLEKLPANVQQLARENYELLKSNPYHPSLHFKRVDRFWSVRVGRSYRALAVEAENGIVWVVSAAKQLIALPRLLPRVSLLRTTEEAIEQITSAAEEVAEVLSLRLHLGPDVHHHRRRRLGDVAERLRVHSAGKRRAVHGWRGDGLRR